MIIESEVNKLVLILEGRTGSVLRISNPQTEDRAGPPYLHSFVAEWSRAGDLRVPTTLNAFGHYNCSDR